MYPQAATMAPQLAVAEPRSMGTADPTASRASAIRKALKPQNTVPPSPEKSRVSIGAAGDQRDKAGDEDEHQFGGCCRGLGRHRPRWLALICDECAMTESF